MTYQEFIQAFAPFFDGFFSAINSLIRIFFDIRIFDIPIIMYVIIPAFICGLFYIIFRGRE